MPELPEVETIVQDLRPVLIGQRFSEITSEYANALIPGVDEFENIKQMEVVDIKRRGKFINLIFENNYVVTIHLRMSGRLILKEKQDPALRFERIKINFGNHSLRFCDQRRFGRVWINKVEEHEISTGIARLGAEPLEQSFDYGLFERIFSRKKGKVKARLLDQSLVAGIGNIYADEACFYAGIRPDRDVSSLSHEELERLFQGVLKALNQGIRNRGTSISDYADAYGNSGKNQEILYVYGRGGKPCMECGSVLQKTKIVQRTTVFCEKCQK